MRYHARNRGVTLVETMIAMTCASVIVLGSTVAVGTSAYITAQAGNEVTLGRDACAALRLIQGVLRGVDHSAITISANGGTLTLNTGAYFSESGTNLVYYSGTYSATILQGDLSSLVFALAPGTSPNSYVVMVALNLTSAGTTFNTQSTIALRN